MNRFSIFLAGASSLALALPASAQTSPDRQIKSAGNAPAPDDESAMIVVNGKRAEGSVVGDIQPEVTFGPADIRSFGVSSISDLIAELTTQTASSQGRGGESPVVLLGGKRVSSFAEIRDIPTEAIQRVEILPEEVALKYGYRPNQKVVNIVLRRRFKAFTGEFEASAPTEGGQFSPQANSSYLRIGNFGRLNLAMKYQHSSALYENERDVIAQTPRQPYDVVGNITSATPGSAIDPGLSTILGRAATVISVPQAAQARAPTLADFANGMVNTTDTRPYRTLLPQTDALTFNAVLARTIFGNVSASFNGSLSYNESDSAQGLATSDLSIPAANPYSPFSGDTILHRYLNGFGALDQKSHNYTGHFGTTMSSALGKWLWTFTGNFDHTASRTLTDRGFDLTRYQESVTALDPSLNPYAPITVSQIDGVLRDRARSISNVGTANIIMSGTLFKLPAGAATTTIKLEGTTSSLSSSSTRLGISSDADLSRDDIGGQISVDVPITSRKKAFLEALGELSANFNFGYDRLSDFGGLRTYGAGINWAPVKQIALIASYSTDEGAPTVQQLGNPLIATTGTRVFDYIQGVTVDITRLSGGNASLNADNRRVLKLGLTLKPLPKGDLSLTINFTNSRIKDPIASFPTATAAIEAAFPTRFTRDADGQLLRIDSRPINFARQDQETLRWGINFSKQLWAPPRPTGAAPNRDGQAPNLRDLLPPGQTSSQNGERPGNDQRGPNDRPGAGGPPGGFGGPGGPGSFGRGPGGRGTRLQMAFYHTIHLRERILIYENGPALDLLNGDAIGSSGGQPRHELQAQLGLTHNGFGARMSGSWQSGTTVNGGTNGAQALRFSDLATLNVRLFANLGQQQALTNKWPFLRGTRISLAVTNIFNSRQHVRDANGDTPISYQPAYLDALGRSVQISIRKLFF